MAWPASALQVCSANARDRKVLAAIAAHDIVARLRVTLRFAHVARVECHVDVIVGALQGKERDGGPI